MKSIYFTKKEIKFLVISILVLGFVFSYNELGAWSNFLSFGLINFLKASIVVAIALFLHELGHKIIAKKYSCRTEYSIWRIQKYGFTAKAKYKNPINLGVWVPLLVSIISNGKLLFPASGSFVISLKPIHRVGKKFTQLTEFELAKIAAAGPLVNLALMFIFKILDSLFLVDFRSFVVINSWIAVFTILPFFGDGTKIFFGGRTFYVFNLVLVLLSFVLLKYISSLLAVVVFALVFAALIAVIYNYSFEG